MFDEIEKKIAELENVKTEVEEEKQNAEISESSDIVEEAVEKETPSEEEKPEEQEESAEEVEEKRENKTPERIRQKLEAKRAEREAEERVREAELKAAKLEGKLEVLEPKAEKVEERIPDKDLEPDAYTEWKLKQVEEREKQLEERMKKIEESGKRVEAEKLWMDVDNDLRATNPMYDGARKFLDEKLPEALKKAHPNVSDAEIKKAVKALEYDVVSKAADPSMIEAIFVNEALKMGYVHNSPKKAELPKAPAKPKSDPREVSFHKKSAGTIADVANSGKAKMSASDLANLSTFDDLMSLSTVSDSQWKEWMRESVEN